MKKITPLLSACVRLLLPGILLCLHCTIYSQITPPGFDRAIKLQQERNSLNRMDRDSITVTDTTIIFDPGTYEETATIVSTTYSLRDFCRVFYAMNNPEILLDGQPHTIIDPKTYEDINIRLTPENTFIITPRKE